MGFRIEGGRLSAKDLILVLVGVKLVPAGFFGVACDFRERLVRGETCEVVG